MNIAAKSLSAGIVLMTGTVLLGFLTGGVTGEEILRKVEEQVERVNDYTVTLDVVVDIERLKVPPMHAMMYYKRPDKVHFDSKGFAMLPRESMGLQFGKLTQRFAVDSVGREGKGAPSVFRLVMHPRDERSAVRKVLLWINGDRWTPERLEIPQADGRVMQAVFTYDSFDECWLPTELAVSFAMAPQDTTMAVPANPFAAPDQPLRSQQRGGQRKGTVTVRYSDYRVNTGLSDDIFVQPEKKNE